MNYDEYRCTQCSELIPPDRLGMDPFLPCPSCGASLRVCLYPSFFKEPEKGDSAQPAVMNEAVCFYHPDRQAASACDECGRFLCALCDLPLAGSHYCAPCLERLKKKERGAVLRDRRLRGDVLTLYLALAPLALLPVFYVSVFTSPAALFIGFRFWNRPLSVLPRSRAILVCALILAAAQVFGWAALVYLGLYNLLA